MANILELKKIIGVSFIVTIIYTILFSWIQFRIYDKNIFEALRFGVLAGIIFFIGFAIFLFFLKKKKRNKPK